MATIVNDPGSSPTIERTVIDRTGDSGAGWAVAMIVLIAVIAVGSFIWLRYYNQAPAAPPANGGAEINVTLPDTTGGINTGGTQSPAPAQ